MVSQYLLLFQYHDHLGISFQVGNLCLKGGDAPLAVAFPQIDLICGGCGPLIVVLRLLRGALHASRLCRAAAAQRSESGREERHGAGEAWASAGLWEVMES